MRLRIIIDDQDAADAPELPLTLTVYRDDDDGTESRIPREIEGEEALIGEYVPSMLRQLADAMEAAPQDAPAPAAKRGLRGLDRMRLYFE